MVVVTCAAVVVVTVLLGGREHRSPFVRFMLLVCVLTGRPPSEYLPPASLRPSRGPGHGATRRRGLAGAVANDGTHMARDGDEAIGELPLQ
jgi:hypothetical protein